MHAVNFVENPQNGASALKSAKSMRVILTVVPQIVLISAQTRGVVSAVLTVCLNVMVYQGVVLKNLIASLVRLLLHEQNIEEGIILLHHRYSLLPVNVGLIVFQNIFYRMK